MTVLPWLQGRSEAMMCRRSTTGGRGTMTTRSGRRNILSEAFTPIDRSIAKKEERRPE